MVLGSVLNDRNRSDRISMLFYVISGPNNLFVQYIISIGDKFEIF